VQQVRPDDHAAVLKVWSKRYRDLVRTRTQVVGRLHAVLGELIPGGVPKVITVARAARVLGAIRAEEAVDRARCELAAAFLDDLRRIDARQRQAKKKLAAVVAATGTSLTGLSGVGPVIAAAVPGDVRGVSRFPGRDHFAACNGTAPIEESCGPRKIYRLSRRGNRRHGHAIHMAAITQVRHRHSQGRACYDKETGPGQDRQRGPALTQAADQQCHLACPQAGARRATARVEGPGRATGERLCRQRGRLAPQAPALRTSHSRAWPPPHDHGQQPSAQSPPVPGARMALPRSLPIHRRRSRRPRWSARSEAKTNDLEARQDDGHTRPRGRPRPRTAGKPQRPEGTR
jgi:Transposase IS116/IS110/IS902 family